MPNYVNIAVFASGAGTTLQSLLEKQDEYGYHVGLVVANRACGALVRADEAHVPTLETRDWDLIDKSLESNQIQLIVLAGFLAIIPSWLCEKWDKRIINIHPSLLPKYGGKGMYGIRVQEAVLSSNDRLAGCTVHYVSAEVDGGNIIAQSTVDVEDNDTAASLSARVQDREKELLPRVIGEIKHTIQ